MLVWYSSSMKKWRSRSVLVAAVIAFSIIAYLAPLSHSPLQTERVAREDDASIDVSGVMKDLLEMAVDLDVPSPKVTAPNTAPDQELQIKDQVNLPLIEATSSDHHVMEANQFLSDWELNPRFNAVQSESNEHSSNEGKEPLEQTTMLTTENINDKGAPVRQRTQREDANSTRLPILDVLVNPFSINESLTLPVPFATLPIKELLQQRWISELQQILLNIPQGLVPVSIVSADYKFREVLINWLVAAMTQAHPPLTHIIVFSLDQPLCELLKGRSIYCIFVAPSTFLTQNAIAHLTRHVAFSEVMALRLTAMRLMNHWGYNTANYDTDAIVLKSPESLYLRHPKSHLIGSYGHFPRELSRVWGATVCCGHFMIRSSPYTEIFWNTISTVLPKSLNDQAKLNYAISALHPDWGNNTKSKSIMRDEWTAITPSGFNVTVLPAKYICRQGCNRKHRSEYYVWHKGGPSSDGKMKSAQRGNLWFLRKDWEARTSNSSANGEEWLREITIPV